MPAATKKKSAKSRASQAKKRGGRSADPHPVPDAAALVEGDVAWLQVFGARQNNLRGVDVHIPLGRFVCVTGVSGSGKSSLVNDIVREVLSRELNGSQKVRPGDHDSVVGVEALDKVIDIDQSPIGRTPRSNPATYIKVFDEIRALYAKLPDAKVRGYKPGRFSFNVKTGKTGGGRCEACEGNGSHRLEMELLADIWMTCSSCGGRRFGRETLQMLYKGRSIADVLDMDVQEALAHFENVPKIADMLRTLHDVGLDYVKLGQSSTTLSGGEAQRIKLARELVKKATGRTLYILDEPTTGLHFEDIRKLLSVLHGFVESGNSVLVIEHNLDVIKTADWLIDLGPEGGAGGGRVIATGTPEQVAKKKGSYTGQALAELFRPTPKSTGGAGKRQHSRRGRTRRELREISIHGARQHNLKGIDVSFPRGKTTVCTGPSGSGKTSLAIDTVYTEGQRRYVESLSAYARQFLGRLQPPRVDQVQGLSPSISIEQKNTSKSPRSTVGTVTEIYDYMRVLWARLGVPYCPDCQTAVGAQDVDEIVEQILGLPAGKKALLLAPAQHAGQSTYRATIERARKAGFRRMRVDGTVYDLDAIPKLSAQSEHRLEVVVDRVTIRRSSASRLADSVEQAVTIGEGVVMVHVLDASEDASGLTSSIRFSLHRSCPSCHRAFDEFTPHHFSFNSRLGWCEACDGLGVQQGASTSAIVVRPTQSILGGAIAGWGSPAKGSALYRLASAVAQHIGFDPETPWHELSDAHRFTMLHGCGDTWISVPDSRAKGAGQELRGVRIQWRGFYPAIDRATKSNWKFRQRLKSISAEVDCQACGGSRLNEEAAAARVADRTIREVCNLPLSQALTWFQSIRLDAREKRVAGELMHEIISRLRFLCDVGLDYVTLHRTASTLSGGESQRIQLASQIGTGLTGVLYVLDEPTIGLHPRDNHRLIQALQRLRDLGNTLLLVEHDREVIESADHCLDFGPEAGDFGGELTASGSPQRLRSRRASLTGQYLSGKKALPIPTSRRDVDEPPRKDLVLTGTEDLPLRSPGDDGLSWLGVLGARENNLKEIDVWFPLGRFTCVTGVSGSGKSTLVSEILHKAIAAKVHRASVIPGGHESVVGIEFIDKVINVDQAPIGNSPSSNPATYTGLFDLIRELFAKLPTSKIRGYTANRFSFNRPGGRCEACSGMGMQCIEMHFLPDVWVECESCQGRRYIQETLDVKFHEKSIADVLEMRVAEALELFGQVPKVQRMLQTLEDVGLGYVQLGQPAPTLSGGEAQRVKLAAELGRPSTGKTLYILDEPTTGLHFDDLRKLLDVLHRLVDLGNTCICIEHNLDVIKTADHVIDLGPEAGAAGGEVVAVGTPEQIVRSRASRTGQCLKPVLQAGPREARRVYTREDQLEREAGLRAPLKLGDDIHMPWERDGRAWHTVDHMDSQGRRSEWDPAVLHWLDETIQGLGARGTHSFAPTDWAHRTRVEITSGKNKQWFAHFLTGGKDLIDVAFRVPDGLFTSGSLQTQLGIKTLDEREDLPIYGQWSRCRVKSVGNGWTAIRIAVRDFKDVRKAVWKKFLTRAVEGYFGEIGRLASDKSAAKPWIKEGRDWHIGQRGVGTRHRVRWKPDLLVALIGRFKSMEPDLEIDWKHETSVQLKVPGIPKYVAKIVTNMGRGLRVELRAPQGVVTPAMIDRLGQDGEIRDRSLNAWVIFWMTSIGHADPRQLRRVWQACVGARPDGRLTA